MAENDKTRITDWLGLKNPPDYLRWPALGRCLGFLLGLVGLIILIFSVIAIVLLLGALTGFGPYAGDPTGAAIRNIGLVLAAVIGVPFLVWRSIVAQKQVDVAEQGHITDRINTAVEGLGATKLTKIVHETPRYQKRDGEWVRDDVGNPVPATRPDGTELVDREVVETSEPNLEVRIGAIYSLERIAQDSVRDHIQIMEILCTYITQNAQTEEVPLPDAADADVDWIEWAKHGQEHLRSDVDAALKVLERRSEERRRLEVRNKHRLSFDRISLRKRNLQHRDLEWINLRDAQLQGAKFGWTNLRNATLWDAQLQGAEFNRTNLMYAGLGGANLCGTILWGTNLQRAYLRQVTMDSSTFMDKVDLRQAAIPGTDLRDVPDIANHLNGMFGDGSVTLPGGHGPDHPLWPAHWPKIKLESQFQDEWLKWRKNPSEYVPPEALEPAEKSAEALKTS